MKGQIPWNKGTKGLQIAWNKGKKHLAGEKHPMFGKHHTPESIEKMKSKLKGRPSHWKGKKNPNLIGINNPNYGKFGKDHPRWTGNKKHSFHKSIRETFKYRQWRSDVFTRDDFTCVLCGVRGTPLQVDHYPKSFIKIIEEYKIKTLDESINCEELWNLNNGRTICESCHKKTDTWGRRKVR